MAALTAKNLPAVHALKRTPLSAFRAQKERQALLVSQQPYPAVTA
jgi:hypothetical protein